MGNTSTAVRETRASTQDYAVPIEFSGANSPSQQRRSSVSNGDSRHGSVSDPIPVGGGGGGRHGSVSDPTADSAMSPPPFIMKPSPMSRPPGEIGLGLANTRLSGPTGQPSSSVAGLHPQANQGAPRHLQCVTFKWTRGSPREVLLMGSFNNWTTPVTMTRENDKTFTTTLDLPVGKCYYKFMVDGEWLHDPTAPTVPNNFGSVNNVIDVRFVDEFLPDGDKALAEPFEQTFPADRSESPPGEYGCEVPSMRRSKPPPQLPPQLLVVTLNSEPFANDPTQLPEPNHVMLNHLYALSIKDHVMVLGVTHRYRKKFVTSVLYKPVDI
eukprot:m.94879 g.94879  ORF g.94879 m.94879 type:complete len:325 (-) comp15430_c0_seq1:292-1266(-)